MKKLLFLFFWIGLSLSIRAENFGEQHNTELFYAQLEQFATINEKAKDLRDSHHKHTLYLMKKDALFAKASQDVYQSTYFTKVLEAIDRKNKERYYCWYYMRDKKKNKNFKDALVEDYCNKGKAFSKALRTYKLHRDTYLNYRDKQLKAARQDLELEILVWQKYFVKNTQNNEHKELIQLLENKPPNVVLAEKMTMKAFVTWFYDLLEHFKVYHTSKIERQAAIQALEAAMRNYVDKGYQTKDRKVYDVAIDKLSEASSKHHPLEERMDELLDELVRRYYKKY